jgi:formylglycine-generating enzyme required for sulfatase activity
MLEAVHAKTGLTFVLIPAGEFLMGSEESEEGGDPDEGPTHTVRVTAFLLCRTECTQRAWDWFGGEDSRRFRGAELPIEGGDVWSARRWCRKAGLRLPSEAEWEYACRAGTTTPFSFGTTITPALVNYDGNHPCGSTPTGEFRERTVECGSLPPNPWGLHEVHGNVYEWCVVHGSGFYREPKTDGYGPALAFEESGPCGIARGGGWDSFARGCRSANRYFPVSHYSWSDTGFRPAADLSR